MNKKIFFILLINYFIPVTYAAQAVQGVQSLMLKSEFFKKKPSYLSPTKSSQGSYLSKESNQTEWKNFLRLGKNPTAEQQKQILNNKKEKSEKQKPPVTNLSKEDPVTNVNKNNTEGPYAVPASNITLPLENKKIEKNKGTVPKELSVSDAKTKAEAYLQDLLKEDSLISNLSKEDKPENKNNKKEEILKKIIKLDQEIVEIENQIIKFEHYNIKEKMNASDREELKKLMKNFKELKDEKIAEKKKLEEEFRNLEKQLLEENFGKDLLSQLGTKIQEDALRDKKYEKEISMLKKEQEKKEKEQKAQKEQASKKGFLGSIKSFFK